MNSHLHGIVLCQCPSPLCSFQSDLPSTRNRDMMSSQHVPPMWWFFIWFEVKRASSKRINQRITNRKGTRWLLLLNSIHSTLRLLWMALGGKAKCHAEPMVASPRSSLCGLSLWNTVLHLVASDMGMATPPPEKECVSAKFPKAQSLVGSFLWKFTLSALPLKSPYGIV